MEQQISFVRELRNEHKLGEIIHDAEHGLTIVKLTRRGRGVLLVLKGSPDYAVIPFEEQQATESAD